MLTLRKFMAACALAHDHDCSHQGWEYDGNHWDWFEDVIGICAIPGRCEMSVYVMNKDKKGTGAEVTVVSLPTEKVDAAAELVGYLDMF